jgi:aspartyl protease family protein
VCLLFAGLLNASPEVSVIALFKDRAVLKVDGVRVVLNVGEKTELGLRLVRANSEQAVVEVNGVSETLTVGTEISASFAPPPAREVQVFRDSNGMYFVTGSINGHISEFLIDTGASQMALNAAQAKRLGLNFRYEGDPTQVQTASGLVNAYLVKLKSVRVGDIEVKDVRAFVIDGAYPATVLLGMSFLERVDLQRTGEVMLIRKKY